MPTQSEIWFEEYCAHRGLPLERIEESHAKTPDYKLRIEEHELIVEVKEILPNPEEKASIEKAGKQGVGTGTRVIPGERVRQKINNASKQIKSRTKGTPPGLLVLCDIRHGCGQVSHHLDRYQMRVAMEGLDQVIFLVPNNISEKPHVSGSKSGPRKKMTQDANTSISAVAVLSTPPGEPIKIEIYHNRFAANPISPESLRRYEIPQYQLSDISEEPSEWTEM